MTNRLQAITDAGQKDYKSSHHYTIFKQDGTHLKRRSFTAKEDSPYKAEVMSVYNLLRYCDDKNYSVEVLTDCKDLIDDINNEEVKNADIDSIRFKLKQTDSTIKWISRVDKKLRLADHHCKELMMLMGAREGKPTMKLFHIEERHHQVFKRYYRQKCGKEATYDFSKMAISKMIKQAKSKQNSNGYQRVCLIDGLRIETRKGRVISIQNLNNKGELSYG